MKTITITIAFMLSLFITNQMIGQEDGKHSELQKEIREAQIKRINEALEIKKQEVVDYEKKLLKDDVEAINEQVELNAISESEGERLRMEKAEQRAKNIENKIAIIDNQLLLIERNGPKGWEGEDPLKISQIELGLGQLDDDGNVLLGIEVKTKKRDGNNKHTRRTQDQLVFSFGLNNVIIDGQSLDDSPYKVGGSRFAELGYTWTTRVFEDSNWLRIKYGVSFQFNGLKPVDNQYFVDTGDQTVLETFPIDLKKSKFRMDNLVIPVHFEIGPSKKLEKNDQTYFKQHNLFKLGIGGYAGVNLGSRQKLKFSENGEDINQKLKSGYNTNNFIYGVSGYIGWDTMSLYAKYDLNSIFKDNPTAQNNVSLGLRWDWD